MTIAMSASVTVSIAEEMTGMASAMSRVSRVAVSAWLGSTSDSAGTQQDVVEGQAEPDVHWERQICRIEGWRAM